MASAEMPGPLSKFDLYVGLALAVVAFAVTMVVTWPAGPRANGDRVTAVIAPRPQPPTPVAIPPTPIAPAPPPPAATLAGAPWVPQHRTPAASVEPALPEGPKLPALPVRLSFPFNSRMGARVVQIVATGSADEPLAVEVEVSNEATGKRVAHTISLNPPRMVTLGQDDGADVQQGDAVKVRAAGYADLVHRVL